MEQQTKDLNYYKRLPYRLRLEPSNDSDQEKYWLAGYEELIGCKTEGKNEVDAVENLYELFDEYIQTHLENNLPIPEPEKVRMAEANVKIKKIKVIVTKVKREDDFNTESESTLAQAKDILLDTVEMVA